MVKLFSSVSKNFLQVKGNKKCEPVQPFMTKFYMYHHSESSHPHNSCLVWRMHVFCTDRIVIWIYATLKVCWKQYIRQDRCVKSPPLRIWRGCVFHSDEKKCNGSISNTISTVDSLSSIIYRWCMPLFA